MGKEEKHLEYTTDNTQSPDTADDDAILNDCDLDYLLNSSSPSSLQQVQGDDNSEGLVCMRGPIGLKLTVVSDFLKIIQEKCKPVSAGSEPIQQLTTDRMVQAPTAVQLLQDPKISGDQPPKLTDTLPKKAGHFTACSLTIGSWQWQSRNTGDLIGKCYYAKKKLVWEVIEGNLKSKIEFNWSNITGIQSFSDKELGVLEVELNEPPKFYIESAPQPRKHTIWTPTNIDFTGGQATTCRRHKMIVLPSFLGELRKLYEKLLDSDPNLLALSQKSLSTQSSLYFPSKIYPSLNFDEYNNQSRIQDIFTPNLGQNSSFAMLGMSNHQATSTIQPVLWNHESYSAFDYSKDCNNFSNFGLQNETYNTNNEPPNGQIEVPYIPSTMVQSFSMEDYNNTMFCQNSSADGSHVFYSGHLDLGPYLFR